MNDNESKLPLSDTLFDKLCEFFASEVESTIERSFDEGTIDRAELIGSTTMRFSHLKKWAYAAKWFAEAFDNDLSRDEYDVTVDGDPLFEHQQFYRSHFIELMVVSNRDATTRHEWRDEGDDSRAYIVVEYPDEEEENDE